MQKYKFLEHTADAKFQAFGKTLEDAFANSALALARIITNHEKIKPKVKRKIKVSSEDLESLLYDFLEQFLILLDSEDFLLNKVLKLKIMQGKKFSLEAEVAGDTNIAAYDVETHAKAITYSDMLIKQAKGKWVVQVVVDL